MGLGVAEAGSETQRIQRAAEIRRRFYRVLFHQQPRRTLAHWAEKFSAVERAMERREAAGDVSDYDRRRISRERVAIVALLESLTQQPALYLRFGSAGMRARSRQDATL